MMITKQDNKQFPVLLEINAIELQLTKKASLELESKLNEINKEIK